MGTHLKSFKTTDRCLERFNRLDDPLALRLDCLGSVTFLRRVRLRPHICGGRMARMVSAHVLSEVEVEPPVAETVDAVAATKAQDQARQQRKAAKKLMKAEKRARLTGDGSDGSKLCTCCSSPSNLLIRCRIDETKAWHMVCGKCWQKVSGGVPDGDAAHPHYCYGGLWKNRS